MKNLSGDKQDGILTRAKLLGALSSQWMRPKDDFRQKAVQRLMQRSGYSHSMACAVLDATFRELSEKKLIHFLHQEIGNPLVLDGFCRDPITGHFYRAAPPKSILHIFASNIPNPAIWSLVMGLLIQSMNFLKPSQHDSGVLELYLASLKIKSSALYGQTKLLPGRHVSIKPYLSKADVVVCYGSDETVKSIRMQVSPNALFVGYGHRSSFALILKEALTKKNLPKLASNLAVDAWLALGQGCLSPLAIYAESGGEVDPAQFEKLFQEKLLGLYRPSDLTDSQLSGAIVSSLKVPVKRFKKIEDFFRILSPQGSLLQAVALEAGQKRREDIAQKLGALGVNRICRAGQMQNPPLTWHHDGKSNISSWLRWTDLE